MVLGPAHAVLPVSSLRAPETKFLKVRRDHSVQPSGLCLLLSELRHKPLHQLLKRLILFVMDLSANVPPGRENMAVLSHIINRGAPAEPWDVAVFARVWFTAPRPLAMVVH
ncbi:MAG: hypothetical protein QW781_07150 [Methanothrix sp.]